MNNYKLDWSKPQRQSAVVIVIAFVQAVKTLWPLLLIVIAKKIITAPTEVASKKPSGFIYGLLGTMAVLLLVKLNDVLQYFTRKFYIKNHHLLITKGLFVKSQITIPLQNIQSLQSTQNILHRFSNTYKIIIDTPGSSNEEVSLLAISNLQFTELQHIVESNTANTLNHQEQVTAPIEQAIAQISITDVLRLAFSENHIKTFLLIVAVVFGKLQDIKDYFGYDSISYVADNGSKLANNQSAIIGIIIFVVFITLLVSFAQIFIKFYNMKIVQQPRGLAIAWGLLATQKKYIPHVKMQLLIWKANALRRWLGLYTLRVFSKAENEAKAKTHIQLAISNKQQLEIIQDCYLQKIIPSPIAHIKPNSNMYVRQILLITLPIFTVLFATTFWFYKWYACYGLLWLVYSIAARILHQKNYNIQIHPQYIQVNKGIWGRENILLHYNKVQHIIIETSPYQRKKNLANILIINGGETVTLPYINKQQAAELVNYILFYVESKGQFVEQFSTA